LVTVTEGVEGGGGGGVLAVKVAVTLVAAFIVTTHVPVPLHPPPLQPANVEPLPAAALSVTDVPVVKFCVHDAVQLMPAGELDTLPVPLPVMFTVSGCVLGGGGGGGGVALPKLAVTLNGPVTLSTQAPIPVHAPLQPVNGSGDGEASRVTIVPLTTLSMQRLPQ
jgi:hypothetical protein